MKKISPLALLLLLLLACDWAAGYSIARFAVTHGVPALGYAFWQSIGPALFLCLLCVWRGGLQREHATFYLVMGLFGIALPNGNMYYVAEQLPAGLLAVVMNTVPVLTYVLALGFGEEHFIWRRFVAVLLMVLGLLLFALPNWQTPAAQMLPWLLLALLTPCCFAICAVYSARCRPATSDDVCLSAGMLLASSALLTPVVFSAQQFYSLTWPLSLVDRLIMLEIVLSSIGYVLFFQLITIAGPVFYSLVSGLVAVIGLGFGWLFFAEQFTPINQVAIGLILTAILLASWRQPAH